MHARQLGLGALGLAALLLVPACVYRQLNADYRAVQCEVRCQGDWMQYSYGNRESVRRAASCVAAPQADCWYADSEPGLYLGRRPAVARVEWYLLATLTAALGCALLSTV